MKLQDIKGQHNVKRAIEIALVGRFNLQLYSTKKGMDELIFEFNKIIDRMFCELYPSVSQCRPILLYNDIYCVVKPDSVEDVLYGHAQETEDIVLERIRKAAKFSEKYNLNWDMRVSNGDVFEHEVMDWWKQTNQVSQFAYSKVIKIATIIACLANSEVLLPEHFFEATKYYE